MPALAERIIEHSLRRNVPLSAQVDLTMRCNEVCVHCYRVIADRQELTADEVRNLLGALARAGTLYLTFSGGEVFLRQDLFDIIAHAKALKFDVRLKSNALLVDAGRARRLRSLGVRQVDVSVYSADPAVHDGVTRVPGSLSRTIEGIRRLREAGVTVKINCPLMTVNADGYRAVHALAQSLDALCGFDPMISAKNDGDTSPVRLRITGPALKRVLQDPVINPALAASTVRPDGDDPSCGASHNACYISSYGDVMPCVALPVACGNVREEPFEAIWYRSPKMREVRAIRTRHLLLCSDCEASPFCSRCPGQALVEDGSLYGPSTAACEHARTSAEAAGSHVVPATMLRADADRRRILDSRLPL